MLRLNSKKVMIVPLTDPDKIGSIYIPEQAKDRSDQGVVKYAASDCQYAQIGDHVLFGAYNGTTIQLEGEGLLILLHEDFISCKLESEDTPVPGLYFRTIEGEFINATHEMAAELMLRNYKDQGFGERIRTLEKFETARRNNVYDERSR